MSISKASFPSSIFCLIVAWLVFVLSTEAIGIHVDFLTRIVLICFGFIFAAYSVEKLLIYVPIAKVVTIFLNKIHRRLIFRILKNKSDTPNVLEIMYLSSLNIKDLAEDFLGMSEIEPRSGWLSLSLKTIDLTTQRSLDSVFLIMALKCDFCELSKEELELVSEMLEIDIMIDYLKESPCHQDKDVNLFMVNLVIEKYPHKKFDLAKVIHNNPDLANYKNRINVSKQSSQNHGRGRRK